MKKVSTAAANQIKNFSESPIPTRTEVLATGTPNSRTEIYSQRCFYLE